MRRAALCFPIILCLLFQVAMAHVPEPHISAKAFWVDPGRQATFGDALNAPFSSFNGAITEGYTSAAVWLKISIEGQTTSEPHALIVKPAFLSRIELYDPLAVSRGGVIHPVVSGRDAKIEANNHVGLDNGFIIPPSRASRDVFLRITTTTSLSADVSFVPLGVAKRNIDIEGAILSVYFALLLGFCIWGLVNLGIRREKVYALFVVRMLYSMAHLFVFIGLLRYFFSDVLSAATRDFLYTFVTVTVVFAAGSFDVRILTEFGVSSSLRTSVLFVLYLPGVSLALLFLGHAQDALRLNALIVTVLMILVCLLAFSVRNTEHRPYERTAALVLRFGYILLAVVILLSAFMHQNVIRAISPVLNLLFLHAIISATILSAVLTIRARQRDVLAQQALFQYRLKEQELKAENERRIEKERFLSMLTHELRNPLALIRLVTNPSTPSGRTVEKAALEMAGVIERVEQSEKLDDEAIRVEMTSLDLKEMLQDLAAHSPAAARIDLEVGRECAIVSDEALVRSIVKNLLDNADKYSPAGSRIRVAAIVNTIKRGEGVRISVSNEAGDAGLPDREKLFTKYYRSRRAHRQPGSGLGLFLVANWAKALGGKISYETYQKDDASQCVTFSLWMPQ